MNLDTIKGIYFLGIGGIGMSALARYFHLNGKRVAGYDRTRTALCVQLEQEGIAIHYEADPAHLQGHELVIYTPAIPRDQVEMQAALAGDIPLMKRAEVLGLIGRGHRVIGVAGTHGKTTTSAMLTHLLHHCGVDATAFVGGIARGTGSNFMPGKAPWMVVEADEYDRSFLKLNPEYAVITSMEPDHLDIYETEAEMIAGFQQFTAQSRNLLVHEPLLKQLSVSGRRVLGYGGTHSAFRAENVALGPDGTSFDFRAHGHEVQGMALSMPGQHNLNNMLAALGIAWEIGVRDGEALRTAVATFSGIHRRFEIHHRDELMAYVDDYAHHPTELAAAMETARKVFPQRQLVVIFQPHLFSRTRDFMEAFGQVLSQADVVLLMEIYPARESPIEGIDANRLLQEVQGPIKQVVAPEGLEEALDKWSTPPVVVLTLGAGNIDREVSRIHQWIKQKVAL